eukprot:TRINITY_DN15646_c0_g1_i1.p1 TRINITY_DN15646_c0_g1~~TRINITY_DN15646_c0_g1_i1.p1  ORF type:complete len:149 (+),score=29.59 TRINITY_DN15646_c0_g1_i1:61-447(+)
MSLLRVVMVCVLCAAVGAQGADTFQQITCEDRECSKNCKSQTFHLNTCLPTTGGGSTIVLSCANIGMDVLEYLIAEDCSGFAVNGQQPVGVCLRQGNVYFMNLCDNSRLGNDVVPLPKTNSSLFTVKL